jgi:hypothetical protein
LQTDGLVDLPSIASAANEAVDIRIQVLISGQANFKRISVRAWIISAISLTAITYLIINLLEAMSYVPIS